MIRTELIAPVPELLRRHASMRGDKVAFEDEDTSITWAGLDASSARLGGHLVDLGVEAGERVALFLPNSVAWVQACLAIVRTGAVCVPISHDASEAEVLYRLRDAQCRCVFTSADRYALVASLRERVPDLARIVVAGAEPRGTDMIRYERLLASVPKHASRDTGDIDCASYIVYTSGTTGKAKGVLLTTRGNLWVSAACWAPIAGLDEHDVVLSPLPLFHSYALNLCVLGIVAVGASGYLLRRFSTERTLALLKEGRFTMFPGVPTMFHYLLEGARGDADLGKTTLRLCVSAGAIMPATLNRDFEERFGTPLLDGYGITETSTMVTLNRLAGRRVPGSCGPPVPGLQVRIVDPSSGRDCETGAEGELIVRGPNLMLGYHRKEAETAAAVRNGWYHTGDLAKSDPNGLLTITGRLKELIVRGGQNIAPAEVEETVHRHEAVLDCAVVGRDHPHLGEEPVVFVVPREGAGRDAEALRAFCRARLSAYKVPAEVHWIDAIPRTGSGKIVRFRLRERLDRRSQ